MSELFEYKTKQLHLRHALDEQPDDKYFSMHVHRRCEIFYFLSGNVKFLVEGYEYTMEPGCLMIMRPSESHRAKIITPKTYERYSLNFYPSVVDSIDPQHQLMKPFMERPLGCGNIYHTKEFKGVQPRDLLEKMCLPAKDDYSRELKIHTHLFSLLDMIREAHDRRGSAEYEKPQNPGEQIVAYVNAHLFEELSVPLLAERFFLSNAQFSRIFKQATGSSPWEYITIKRLVAVREQVHNGEFVREASEKCGFTDYSAFYRAYVKYFGRAPKYDKKP